MLLEFQRLIQRFFGSQIQRKRNGGDWLLKYKLSQGSFQRFVGSVNKDKYGEGDQSWRYPQIKD